MKLQRKTAYFLALAFMLPPIASSVPQGVLPPLLPPAGLGTVRAEHPRLLVTAEDLPLLRARCGVEDGDNRLRYADQWGTHAVEYSTVKDYSDNYPDYSGNARYDSHRMITAAFVYLIEADPVYRDRAIAIMDAVVANGTLTGETIGRNGFEGFYVPYDWLFNYLKANDPSKLANWAGWIKNEGELGEARVTNPNNYSDHYDGAYYLYCMFPAACAIYGDEANHGIGTYDADAQRLYNLGREKMYRNLLARTECEVGLYDGYRHSCNIGWDVTAAETSLEISIGSSPRWQPRRMVSR